MTRRSARTLALAGALALALTACSDSDDYEATPTTEADGGTDETDHKVLWVVTSMPCSKLEEWMRERGLEFEMVSATDVHTGDDAVDFDLPEEEHDFVAAVRERSK